MEGLSSWLRESSELVGKAYMDQTRVGLRKGAWSTEEDIRLRKCVEKFGEGRWHQVPSRAGLNRCRKSCRLRWLNYLRPDIKRGFFSREEVDLLRRLHKLLGNRWSLIAGRLPGRTANDVKNFWNTHMSKKLVAAVAATAPTPRGECNEFCKNKTTAIIHNSGNQIIKPRPRNFFKPTAPIQHTTGGKNPQTGEENTEHKEVKTSATPHIKPWTAGVCENAKNKNLQCSSSVPEIKEDDDECIQWWKDLLETTTESREMENQFLVPDKDKDSVQIEVPNLSLPDHQLGETGCFDMTLEFGTLSHDDIVDVWELL